MQLAFVVRTIKFILHMYIIKENQLMLNNNDTVREYCV